MSGGTTASAEFLPTNVLCADVEGAAGAEFLYNVLHGTAKMTDIPNWFRAKILGSAPVPMPPALTAVAAHAAQPAWAARQGPALTRTKRRPDEPLN